MVHRGVCTNKKKKKRSKQSPSYYTRTTEAAHPLSHLERILKCYNVTRLTDGFTRGMDLPKQGLASLYNSRGIQGLS